ncbi:MAG: hypothetical protein LW817_03785 [Candidatus Caenarcaniphilales bacterium]|jgi:hypothetical protein|nr:hypothetical protein [Candidatus Caenarcaniphilales bacterium]
MQIDKTSITFTSNALANQGQATSAVQNTNNAPSLASISAKEVKEKNPESAAITINNIAKLQNTNKEKRIILVDAGKPGDSIYGNTLAIALNIVKKLLQVMVIQIKNFI